MPPSRIKFVYCLLPILIGFILVSKYIFDKIYSTSTNVVDEQFHLPQGMAYCNHNFTYWNGKITTLPGLYIISTPIGLFDCNTYNLRLVNLIGASINLVLLASILKYIYLTEDPKKIAIQALNIAILPPLYFFSHLYYTDTWSLTFMLLYSRLCLSNCHYVLLVICGIFCVLMRQTNIVWIAMFFGQKFLDVFLKSSRVYGNRRLNTFAHKISTPTAQDIDSSKLKRFYNMYDLVIAKRYHIKMGMTTFLTYITDMELNLLATHAFLLTLFVIFIIYNKGSIVVGDKQAHEVTIHIPQMLYFLLFYGFFGLPYVLTKLKSTLKLLWSNKTNAVLFTVLMVIAVHYNTLTHPYLLADNRHYTFYVWNRWFGRYFYAKYATIPAYLFLLFNLYDNLRDHNCITFLFPYTVCFVFVLSLQKMIEVRYFLVPYIILRLRFARPSWIVVLFEFVWFAALNYITLKMFFTKQIEWSNFADYQRIMW